jgi:hypothetical protein
MFSQMRNRILRDRTDEDALNVETAQNARRQLRVERVKLAFDTLIQLGYGDIAQILSDAEAQCERASALRLVASSAVS